MSKDKLISALADSLTYEDVIKGKAYAKGYVKGFADGLLNWKPLGIVAITVVILWRSRR